MPNRTDTKDQSLLIERLAGRIEAVEHRVTATEAQISALIDWKEEHDKFAMKASTEYASGIADLKRRLDEGLTLDRGKWDKLMTWVIQPIIQLATVGALVAAVTKLHT